MNPLSKNVVTGTVGELLVQLRLLQYGVQAAPPLKDSGNDLIAVFNDQFRAVQVKTTGNKNKVISPPDDRVYHLLAHVVLVGEENNLWLDHSEIYLLTNEEIAQGCHRSPNLEPYLLSEDRVMSCFASAEYVHR